MTYDADLARLANAVGRLLASGSTPAAALRGAEPPAATACRDAVVVAMRGLAASVSSAGLSRGIQDREFARAIAGLHDALLQLPRAAPDPMPFSRALDVAGGAVLTQWQQAARAAVALEPYQDLLRAKHAPAASRDLAALVTALPTLDADLAGLLPGRSGMNVGALLDMAAHERLVAAAARVPGVTTASGPVDVERPLIPRVAHVRNLSDTPAATLHLAALIERRGIELTVLEVRAGARVLADGVELAAALLPEDVAELRSALAPALTELMHGQVATLTKPAHDVLWLAAQIRQRLVTGLGTHNKSTLFVAETQHSGTSDMTRWLSSASHLAQRLHAGLTSLAADGKLLVPRQNRGRSQHEPHLWMPEPPAAAAHLPAIAAAQRMADIVAASDFVSSAYPAPPTGGRASTTADARAAIGRVQLALVRRSHTGVPSPAGLKAGGPAWPSRRAIRPAAPPSR